MTSSIIQVLCATDGVERTQWDEIDELDEDEEGAGEEDVSIQLQRTVIYALNFSKP
jgi:hypothetical protein